jgi:hypothetical protein
MGWGGMRHCDRTRTAQKRLPRLRGPKPVEARQREGFRLALLPTSPRTYLHVPAEHVDWHRQLSGRRYLCTATFG